MFSDQTYSGIPPFLLVEDLVVCDHLSPGQSSRVKAAKKRLLDSKSQDGKLCGVNLYALSDEKRTLNLDCILHTVKGQQLFPK